MTTNFLYNFVKENNVTKSVFIAYIIGFAVILYFIFFTIFGTKGLFELVSLRKKIENKDITKQELQTKMEAKKNMVDGMSPESLDLDLLDEESRKVLGYVKKGEIVVYQENAKEEQK